MSRLLFEHRSSPKRIGGAALLGIPLGFVLIAVAAATGVPPAFAEQAGPGGYTRSTLDRLAEATAHLCSQGRAESCREFERMAGAGARIGQAQSACRGGDHPICEQLAQLDEQTMWTVQCTSGNAHACTMVQAMISRAWGALADDPTLPGGWAGTPSDLAGLGPEP